MTCLNEKIVGAAFFMLSGYAFAQSTGLNAPETMTVANIPSIPMEVLPALPPEPQAYLHRYEMAYQANQPKPFYAQVEGFYSAPVAQDKYHYDFVKSVPGSRYGAQQQAAQPTTGYLQMGPSTAPQISLLTVPDSTLNIGAQPQRRLSLTVDEWVFSATARVAILHSHSTGATVTVRRGF
ncbi:hypothetical protein [Paraburkholderia silvatlantica]|uniref:Peptidoglycan-binding protein CsiV n=1 Tax=Paraburkholderia silvatlantica TaxID=321895 RepID=A0A2V4TU72_9BURK|nr:hypothetical protein [Paraburkholderia silvatlantica]PYE24888.1 hypothetical protein C7410_105113 [Paraburkholderia silvatlantica]TDR05082.1 hypothetical protein C7412_101329 [Paraburkholderia silvatlantica]